MAIKQNLKGKSYGKLTVIKEACKEDRLGKAITWECLCECGRIHKVTASNLRNGKTKSCGCLKTKYPEGIVGVTFGKLTVVKDTGERTQKGSILWECSCSCGSETVTISTDLTSGNTTSCGCNNHKYPKGLLNKTFGNLTVTSKTSRRANGKVIWTCLCICGNTVEVPTGHLTSGHTISCGCYKDSKGEKAIKGYLDQRCINYTPEYSIEGLFNQSDKHLLRFDFCLLNRDGTINVLIEYDGIQHFEVSEYFGGQEGYDLTVLRDNLKNEYCKVNNIQLIRIPYTHYNDIENILNKTIN